MFLEYLKGRKLLFFILITYLTILGLNAAGNSVWLPSCPIHKITGHECLGCGSSRAMISLLSLQIEEAWHFNKLVFIYVPLSAFFLLRDFYKYFINHKYSKQNKDYGKI